MSWQAPTNHQENSPPSPLHNLQGKICNQMIPQVGLRTFSPTMLALASRWVSEGKNRSKTSLSSPFLRCFGNQALLLGILLATMDFPHDNEGSRAIRCSMRITKGPKSPDRSTPFYEAQTASSWFAKQNCSPECFEGSVGISEIESWHWNRASDLPLHSKDSTTWHAGRLQKSLEGTLNNAPAWKVVRRKCQWLGRVKKIRTKIKYKNKCILEDWSSNYRNSALTVDPIVDMLFSTLAISTAKRKATWHFLLQQNARRGSPTKEKPPTILLIYIVVLGFQLHSEGVVLSNHQS